MPDLRVTCRWCQCAVTAKVIQTDTGRCVRAGEDPRRERERTVSQFPGQAVCGDLAPLDLGPTGAALGVDSACPDMMLAAAVNEGIEPLLIHQVVLPWGQSAQCGLVTKDGKTRDAVDRVPMIVPRRCIAVYRSGVSRPQVLISRTIHRAPTNPEAVSMR